MSTRVSTWAATVLLSLAPNQQAETRGARFLRLATDARLRTKDISIEDVRTAIDQAAKIFDVREKEEYQRGHLPSSIHLSRGLIELVIERWVPDPATPVILYCGAGNRSALAADNLQKMGYTNVSVLTGGFRAWLEAGQPSFRGRQMLED